MISLIWVMNITCGINKEEKLYVRLDSQKTPGSSGNICLALQVR